MSHNLSYTGYIAHKIGLSAFDYLFWLTHRRRDLKEAVSHVKQTNCLYIHIPKAAGTSISHAIYKKDLGHFTLEEYLTMFGPISSNTFTFSFVRNPWDRLVSTYEYAKKMHSLHGKKGGRFSMMENADDFNTFVKKWITKKNTAAHYFFYSQSKYLHTMQVPAPSIWIGCFERISEDFDALCKHVGEGYSLKKMNIGSKERMSHEYFDNQTISIVADVYADDIRNFGYDDGPGTPGKKLGAFFPVIPCAS